MKLDRSDINFKAENHKLFGENQVLLHQKNKLTKELDHYKTAHHKLTAGLKEAVAESIQFKRERDELSKKLDKECNMSLNIEGQLQDMTKQRDSLIKDVEKLRNWFKLKENIKHMITSVYPEVKEHVVDYAAGQFNILEELGSQIDELEGNHDIQNLLDDLGRE